MMRKSITLFISLCGLFTGFSQQYDSSWSVGLGVDNFAMHGDLRSYRNVSGVKGKLNPGGYLFVDKMVSPAFGFELKFHYQKMRGAAFELSDNYPVQGTDLTLGKTRFEGISYGAELSAILNLSGLAGHAGQKNPRKWNWSLHAGMGMQYYDSKLYAIETGSLLVDYGQSPSANGISESLYYLAGLGLKYRINNHFDLGIRQEIGFNEEDHLDAAMCNKQSLDIFSNTGINLIYHINKHKEVLPLEWQSPGYSREYTPGDSGLAGENTAALIDSDADGVIDLLDKDPDTPFGVLVYANGVPIDTDYDGIPDYKDKCPLVYSNLKDGCPGDKDGDGIRDDKDLCADIPGVNEFAGCPEVNSARSSSEQAVSVQSIFFDLDSDYLKSKYNKEISGVYILLKQNKDLRVMLEGYADTIGSKEYNFNLSERRAQKVKMTLVGQGVSPDRISIRAYGSTNPTFKEPHFRAYNRRVDIILLK